MHGVLHQGVTTVFAAVDLVRVMGIHVGTAVLVDAAVPGWLVWTGMLRVRSALVDVGADGKDYLKASVNTQASTHCNG